MLSACLQRRQMTLRSRRAITVSGRSARGGGLDAIVERRLLLAASTIRRERHSGSPLLVVLPRVVVVGGRCGLAGSCEDASNSDEGYLIDRATQAWFGPAGSWSDSTSTLAARAIGERRLIGDGGCNERPSGWVAVWSKVEDSLSYQRPFRNGFDCSLLRARGSTSTSERPVALRSVTMVSGRVAVRDGCCHLCSPDDCNNSAFPWPTRRAYGIDSRVVIGPGSKCTQLGAAWLRTCVDRQTVLAVVRTRYFLAALRPSVRVMFPLPNAA